jgi:hypothetical protein
MTKIDVGVGKEFPVESDEKEREEREALERERLARGEERDDEHQSWGCGDYREAREYYRNRYGRDWRRHMRGHWGRRHGSFFPNFIWIAAGVALIIVAAKAPFWTLALIAIVAFVLLARRNGLIGEIVRDIREGWDGAGGETSGPRGPGGSPASSASSPASGGTTSSASSSSNAISYNNPTTGSGEGAGTRS